MMGTLMQNRACTGQARVNDGRPDLLTAKRLSNEDSNYPRALSVLFDDPSAPELTVFVYQPEMPVNSVC